MRTKTVKKASRVIIEKYYGRLTMDFDTNKRVVEEVAIIGTKRLRNKIAGFTTVSGCTAQQAPADCQHGWGISFRMDDRRATACSPANRGGPPPAAHDRQH